MDDRIVLTRSSLVRLLDGLFPNPEEPGTLHHKGPFGPGGPGGPVSRREFQEASWASALEGMFPNPEEPGNPNNPWGPYGPGGPVSREQLVRLVLSRALWAMLNPQPLPPVAGPQPEPWRQRAMFDPEPSPWRSALLARGVVDQAVAAHQATEMFGNGAQTERASQAIRAYVHQFADDYCGTVPHRWPRPWPWPYTWEPEQITPLELLVAGAQFQKAADALTDSPLHEDFASVANQLFETGLKRLESEQTRPA